MDLSKITRLSHLEKKTLSQRVLKLGEELGELAEAALSSEEAPGCSYKGLTDDDVAEEAVDVAQIALSIALMFYTEEEVEALMDRKLLKWEKIQQEERNAHQKTD